MENIEIKDFFKIDDSHSKIRGFVVLKDQDGNIIAQNENMIVKGGRAAILNSLTSGTALEFSKFEIGDGVNVTSPDATKLENARADYTITTQPTPNTDDLTLKFELDIVFNIDPFNFTELGLFLNDGTMFSRVVFPKRPINTNTTYRITYYIYF